MTYFSDINEYSDEAILKYIGGYVKQLRIAKNIKQGDLADRAAVSRSTLSLMENGENVSVTNLIKVLRMLEALHVLEGFSVPETISPLQLVKAEQKKRKRASGSKQSTDDGDLGW